MRISLRILSRVSLSALLAGCLLVGGAACSSHAPGAGSGRVPVVAAENFWGSIARQVGGSAVAVTSVITNPNADPHDYEPTATDARTIATAKLVIENGIGYDPWVNQLTSANPASGRVVLDVGKVVGGEAGGNPHQWYSLHSVEEFVTRLTSDLSSIDPTHAVLFAHNADAFESHGLAAYKAIAAQIRTKFAGTPIGASESIVSPLAETLGLKLLTPDTFLRAISEGSEPYRR